MSDKAKDEKKSGKSKGKKKSKKSKDKPEKKEEIDNINNNENPKNSSSIISTRAYLEQNVTPIIQEAMLECAKKRPSNPLKFIGQYILNRAEG